jgi:hypothetical protein
VACSTNKQAKNNMFMLYEIGSFLSLASGPNRAIAFEASGYNKAERLVLLNLNSQQADVFQRGNVTGFLELKRGNKGHSLLDERGMWTKHSMCTKE